LAIQPEEVTELPLLNKKVRQPSVLDEVNGPGIVEPQNPPVIPPGTLPAGLPLEIFGAPVEFPSKTYKASKVASVLKDVNVTVTASPGFDGHIVVVVFSLLA
jgi:hypothetical protein